MKRTIAFILAALMLVFLLSACKSSEPASNNGDGSEQKQESTVDLSKLLSDINTEFNLTGLKTIEDTDNLNRYYQISAEDVKQFAAELSSAASQYTEIVIVEGADQTACDNIKKLLDQHRNSQLNNAKSYDADQVSMIESCEVKQTGNYVYLVVSDQYSDIAAAIEKELK